MTLYLALLLLVFCLAFPTYAPETQDRAGVESQEANQNPETVADKQQALAAHLKSARELRQANELVKAAQFLNRAGQLQLQLNLPDEAMMTFQQSLKLAERTADPVVKVDALNGLSAVRLRSRNYREALPLIQQALTISERNNYPQGRAEALLLLAAFENRTNHTQALKIAHEALALWQTIGDNNGIIRSHLHIGDYQLAQNSLTEATESNETARHLSRTNNFKDLEAQSLINLGFIEFRKGAWHNVTKFLWDAGKLFDAESDPFKMTQISAAIGEAYIESGLPETGLPKYQEALEYIRKTKDPRSEAIIRWGIGRTLFFSGRYPEAKVALEEALGLGKSLKEPIIIAMCHESLGATHVAMNDPTAALRHLETALTLYSDTENPMEAARTRALMGQVYENSGRFVEARQFYQDALQRFDRHSDGVNQSATLFALGRLEMKAGNFETGESHLQRAIEITEQMRRMSTSRDLTAAFSATVHGRYEQYIQCLMRNHHEPAAASRVVRAFETSESARARSLAELVRVSDMNLLSNVDPELSKQERAVRQLLRVKEDDRVSLLRRKYEKNQLEKLDAELERLTTEYKNTLAIITERYPAFAQITQPQGWTLLRIQQEVINDDDTLLLEYLLGEEKSYVWAVTRSSISSYELPSQTVISDAVKIVYDLLRERPNPDANGQLDQAKERLAQIILSPVAAQLNKLRIIVAADGALNYIPFQILPANGQPLVANHEIINTPSASILGELRRESAHRGVRQKVLAAFGNPIFAEQQQSRETGVTRSIEIRGDTFDPATIGRLFYSGREIANLREVATDEQTFAATEYEATRDKLLSTDLTQYAVLHFATHGLLDPARPENSGLLLSTKNRDGGLLNGFVGLQDVYSLRAPVDLVVLSACQTGLGKNIRGEGLIGLTRGFMYAGATSVVASLWKVEDEATAELMKLFYIEMLKNGKTPAEALRAAQNSIRQIPEWNAPHYWAGFTLQGEYRYVVNSSRTWPASQIVMMLAIVLVLALAGYLFFRLRTKNYVNPV